MKHCTSCGKELKDQAKFCTRCGNKCSENSTEKPRLTQIQQELPEEKTLPHVEPPLQEEMTPAENAAPKEAGQDKTVSQGELEEKSEPVEQPSERKKTIQLSFP